MTLLALFSKVSSECPHSILSVQSVVWERICFPTKACSNSDTHHTVDTKEDLLGREGGAPRARHLYELIEHKAATIILLTVWVFVELGPVDLDILPSREAYPTSL